MGSTWVCGGVSVYNLGDCLGEKAHKERPKVWKEALGRPRSPNLFLRVTVKMSPGSLHDTTSWIQLC